MKVKVKVRVAHRTMVRKTEDGWSIFEEDIALGSNCRIPAIPYDDAILLEFTKSTITKEAEV